jgi:hypothetical protein
VEDQTEGKMRVRRREEGRMAQGKNRGGGGEEKRRGGALLKNCEA